MPQAIISFGSNVQPEDNIAKAIELLAEDVIILVHSPVYETPCSEAPDARRCLNGVVVCETDLDPEELVDHVLKPIEMRLQSERTGDANSPRTIELDLLQHEFGSTDRQLMDQVFVAVPMADIAPDRIQSGGDRSFAEVAEGFATERAAFVSRPEVDARLAEILAG